MTPTNWSKYKLLMWKNWKQQWAHKALTLNELIVPLIYAGALLMVRGFIDIEHHRTITPYKSVSLDQIPIHDDFNLNTPIDWDIVYAPKNQFLDVLIQKSAERLNCTFTGIENIEDLDKYLLEKNSLAGILFDESYKTLQELPDKLNFILRFPSEMRSLDRYNPLLNSWKTDLEFPKFALGGPRDKTFDDGGPVSGYIAEGFVQVQNMISRVFIEEKTGQIIPKVKLQRYPYPQYIKDLLSLVIEMVFPLLIIHCFAFSIINTVKSIVMEKKIKETLKIMGIPTWIHWMAWFSKAMPLFILAFTIMVIMFKTIGGDDCMFTHSSWTVLWIFFLLYSICTIMFCFMLSSIFTDYKKAISLSVVLFFWLFVPFNFGFENLGLLLLSCLSLNASMGYGLQMFMRWEKLGVGLQWSNLFSTLEDDTRGLTAGYTFLMLIFNSCLYLLVALYLEKVIPGKFGVAERWNFIFTKRFWRGSNDITIDCESQISLINNENFEDEPVGKNMGVQMKGLRKVNNNKKETVQGVSLNLFEDEITVLLGNNGSGKKTLISMLNGRIPATSGTALINGKDVSSDIEGVRKSLGICPKYNIFFEHLTVRENIVFYCRVKGLNNNEIEIEVQKSIKALELEDDINTQSVNLSDSVKRKLSIGIALCGGSKVILCDEPTSSLDPHSRLDVWKLLKSLKKDGRTILLSTHFVDEADALGDRIAIMAGGDLKCCGSPYFLKNKFGVGYRLNCVKEYDCNSKNVTSLISKYVPGVIQSDIGTELSYEISEKSSNLIPNICKELETESKHLGIKSFGISTTTLEDVFIKVGNDPNESTDTLQELNLHNKPTEVQALKGYQLRRNQFFAIFKYKTISFLRSWFLMFQLFHFPVIFLTLVITSNGMFDSTETLPNREFSLNNYKQTVTVLETHASVAQNSFEYNIAAEYKKYITKLPDSNSLDAITDDIQNHFIKLGTASLKQVDAEYIVGASVTTDGITAWFNNQPYHGIPISVNTVYNAILRAAGCTDCEINVSNSPLPFTKESHLDMLTTGNNFGFQLALAIGLSLSIIGAFFSLHYIEDRVSGGKLLNLMSGVNSFVYWLSTLLWDYLVHLVIILIIIVALIIFDVVGFSTIEELGHLVLLLMFYGFEMLAMNSVMSFYFKKPMLGFLGMLLFGLFTGIVLFGLSFFMKGLSEDSRNATEILRYIFMILPNFALCDGISNMHTIHVMRLICNDDNSCEESTNYLSWINGILANLIYMMLTTVFGIVGLYMVETGYFKKNENEKMPESRNENVDNDVQLEKDRIDNMTISEISSKKLVVQKISKNYEELEAVNQISFDVKRAESFCLLGINKSGKTSAIKMLTGHECLSQGEVWTSGYSLKEDKEKVFENIGYCPQIDVLTNKLTGRETLRLFSVLRGIPDNLIDEICNHLVTQLNLKKQIKKKINTYNRSTKRKLHTAIALIGNQSVVYLDEPTTGLDPASKRAIWDLVLQQRNSGKSIVLSTLSVDECEVLSSKLAVMVDGEFKCIGSPQHLKNKFNNGYILTVRVGKCEQLTKETEKITDYILNNFKDSFIRNEYQSILTYYIPNKPELLCSEMFKVMENYKETGNIRDYSINETTLEEIFFSLVTEKENQEC